MDSKAEARPTGPSGCGPSAPGDGAVPSASAAQEPQRNERPEPPPACGGALLAAQNPPISLAGSLRQSASRHAGKHVIHIGPDGSEFRHTYAQLWEEATRILKGLRKLGIPPGGTILFQFDASRDFIPAFWGAVLGGFVPVPLAVPATSDPAGHAVRKLCGAWLLLEKPQVLSCERLAPLLRPILEGDAFQGAQVAYVERLRRNEPEDALYPGNGDDVALIMLTSGSTGVPKGVMLTHRNLLARSAGAQHMNGFSIADRTLSWMPLDHVAGLVMFHLQDVFVGCEQIHVAPGYILQEPLRWIDLIHRYRVAVTFAPNFAFGLINDNEPEIARREWDLSCVRYFLNGGEAILARTARRFLSLLAAHGLGAEVMHPIWGMSETCSGVTFNERFSLAGTSDEDVFVDLGPPIPGVELRIVDEHDCVTGEGITGRLQCRGSTLMAGYWRNPDLTGALFTPDGWFETGDRAYLREGRLTLTGREKDIIIIHGLHYHCHEIESAAEEVEGVAASFTAACAVRGAADNRERTAVFFVCREGHEADKPQITGAIRSRVIERVGINPDHLLCVRKEDIPKTEIGKIQRSRLRARFEAGEFGWAMEAFGSAAGRTLIAPRTPLEQQLALVWAEVLGLAQVGVRDDFFELGGHSLLAARLMAWTGDLLQLDLPLAVLFDAPTIESLVRRIEAAGYGAHSGPILPVVCGPGAFCRASFAQERLWFLDQLFQGNPVYNIPIALRLEGPLDLGALQKALDTLVVRHAALRTTFRSVDEQLMQVIDSPRPVDMKCVDLRDRSDSKEGGDLAGLLRREARRAFDLSADLMLRATLCRVDVQAHILLIVLHHIAFDGLSEGVFFREMNVLYAALADGHSPAMADPPVLYADYGLWQRKRLDGPVRQTQIAFWKDYLDGAPPALDLPLDHPRPAYQTHAGSLAQRPLPESIDSRMEALGRQEQVTTFMIWLAAVNALLHRYTGQEDIIVGTPVAGRSRAELEHVIGFFVNTVPVRSDLSGTPTFRELIRRIRKSTLAAYSHPDLPFEQVVEALHPSREANRSALFQVMFVLHEGGYNPRLARLNTKRMGLHTGTAMFDLTITVSRERGAAHVLAEYNTDLFDAGSINRMLAHFEALVEAALRDPDSPISRHPLLTADERNEILVAWNDTRRGYPRDTCIHELFQDQVEKTPNAVAAVFGEDQLTYRELNRRSNQLAHYLRKHRVGPDVIVAICMERSLEMVVSILGILKAGGAYLPLDPDCPKERLEFMIEDARAPVLITQRHLAPSLAVSSLQLLCLDTDRAAMSSERQENPPQNAGAENLAYVIYTSGSTGRPKGVMISHRSLCNHMAWLQRAHPLSASDAVLQRTPFSFDASVWEFYAPLLAGARLIVAPPGAHADADVLVRVLIENKVSVLQLVPSLLVHLLEKGTFRMCRSLKHVFCGGEVLSADLANRVFEQLPSVALHNLYGPTEATIDALCWSCLAHGKLSTVPIGRPIDNVQAYVVDTHLQPVPAGVSGELLLGGDGLARGYLGLPELTAEKFIADPFSGKVGARLYRTGDLVRWLADGNLEFLGRTDDQVKIRGYRIEPGEIESVLARHPQVKQAAIVAREDTRGGKRLVAYTVPAGEQPPSFKDLRGYLKQSLPDYMVPSAFVSLDKLPLMPSGKVDRLALPAPDMDRLEAPLTYEAPRLPVEELVAKIWSEVLGVERVGIRDNFFDMGGHSLLATRMMARVRHTFEVDLPLRALFDSPTVEGMALAVVQCMSMKEKTEFDDLLGETWEES